MTNFNPIYFVPTRQNIMSITFDDGPTPGITDQILPLLEKHKIKATFFMVGESVLKYPSLAKEVASCGHEIGVHSHKHKHGMKRWKTEEVIDDYAKGKDAIISTTGVVPRTLRSPYGNICESVAESCSRLDLSYVGWSVSSKDWKVVNDIKRQALLSFSTNGSIALFHDGRRMTAGKLDGLFSLIESLVNHPQHLSFVTASSLISSWDDSAIHTLANGIPLLGHIFSQSTPDSIEGAYYWHQSHLLDGITYSVCNTENTTPLVEATVLPMSNIDEWCKTIMIADIKNHNIGDIKAIPYDHSNIRANLSCGDHIIPGWDNFDIPIKAINGIHEWQWNKPLPYADNSVSLVLIQHCTNHCSHEDFIANFTEIRRVLKHGGKVLVKDADDRRFVWRKIGSHLDGGVILSTMSEPKMREVLVKSGFVNVESDTDIIIARHGSILNRTNKLRKGLLFAIEGVNP